MFLLEYTKKWNEIINSYLTHHTITMSYGVSVQSNYIPEPFMGDPENSSFVIVNLNPGAGQCHSCINQKNVKGTLINKVAMHGYSNAVKDFPYLQEEKNVGLKDWDNSGGRKWWKAKERWIKHIIKMFEPSYNTKDAIPQDLYPFAMELFAWHTMSWPSELNKKMKKNGIYGLTIKNEVLEPLYDAIQKSKFKFAFCVGKPIGGIIEILGDYEKLTEKSNHSVNGIKRDYEVYSDGKGRFIVNTWAQGGNTYPSEIFYQEEEKLFKKYRIILIPKEFNT